MHKYFYRTGLFFVYVAISIALSKSAYGITVTLDSRETIEVPIELKQTVILFYKRIIPILISGDINRLTKNICGAHLQEIRDSIRKTGYNKTSSNISTFFSRTKSAMITGIKKISKTRVSVGVGFYDTNHKHFAQFSDVLLLINGCLYREKSIYGFSIN